MIISQMCSLIFNVIKWNKNSWIEIEKSCKYFWQFDEKLIMIKETWKMDVFFLKFDWNLVS